MIFLQFEIEGKADVSDVYIRHVRVTGELQIKTDEGRKNTFYYMIICDTCATETTYEV